MDDSVARALRGIGWLLLIGGGAAAGGYGIFVFLLSDMDAPVLKWGLAAFYLGWIVLFLAVLRQRLIARKTDRYKDVEI